MLHRVALVRADVSKELVVSIIGVTRISGLGTTLVVTSNRRTQSEVPPKRWFLQEPHGERPRRQHSKILELLHIWQLLKNYSDACSYKDCKPTGEYKAFAQEFCSWELVAKQSLEMDKGLTTECFLGM
jgi:hypothetical protein